jgi:O-antigen/teichoic acid export membrane protein
MRNSRQEAIRLPSGSRSDGETDAGNLAEPTASPQANDGAFAAAHGTSFSIKVLALSSGNAIALLAGMVAAMVAARVLTKGDWATIRQTFLAYEMVTPLLLLGLPQALYFLLPRAGEDRRGAIIDGVALLTATAAVFCAFIVFGGSEFLAHQFDNPALERTLPWLTVYALSMLPVAMVSTALVLANRVRTLALYNVAVSLATAGGIIAAILTTRSFEHAILARIGVAVFALPIGLWLMMRATDGDIRFPQPGKMLAMARYSAPLSIAFMFGAITLQVHALIVSLLCTPEEFAVYINGAMEVPFINAVVGAIATVVLAEMSDECARGNKLRALEIFKNATVRAAYVLFPTMVYFAIVAQPFIIVLYSESYVDSTIPFLIYLLVIPGRIAVYGSALMAIGMNRIVLIRTMIDLIVLTVISLIFVYLIGYNGAAFGLVLSLYLFTIPYCLHYISMGYSVSWRVVLPWRRLADVLGIALVCAPLPAAVVFLADGLPPLLKLAAAAVLYGVPYGAILLVRGVLVIPSALSARLPARLRAR